MKPVALLASASLALLATAADARVYALQPFQTLEFANPEGVFGPPKVAIDGDAAIVLLDTASGREAVLLRRNAAGVWAVDRTLLSVPTSSRLRNEIEMRDGKAAILLDDYLHIYERGANGAWTESATAGTPRAAGGIAISGGRILVGRFGCTHDANVFEKSVGSGVWRITALIAGAAEPCTAIQSTALDIHQNVALLFAGNESRVFQYQSATGWQLVDSFRPASSLGDSAPALHENTAIFDYGYVWRHDTYTIDNWTARGSLTPLNSGNGASGGFAPNYRDGFIVSHTAQSHPRDEAHAYVHLPTGGSYDAAFTRHHALLYTPGYANQSDMSGRIIVSSSQGLGGERYVSFFDVPAAAAPPSYANDFQSSANPPLSQTPGSQFALVNSTAGGNVVYRQSSLVGEAQASVPGIDWTDQQTVEADITPTAIHGANRWVGIALRYTDSNNHYYVTLRSSNVIELKRKVAGVYATLASAPLPFAIGTRRHVRIVANRGRLTVDVDGVQRLAANDTALTNGSVAMLTYRARADFDNLHASPTAPFELAIRDFTDLNEARPPLWECCGTWTPVEGPDGEIVGRAQTSTTSDVIALTGSTTDDQVVSTRVRLDAYGASGQGAWFGLIGRWRDEENYYYLTVRSTGRLEIRRKTDNMILTLASVPFAAQPGRFYELKFSLRNDELHAFVDGVLVAQAHDAAILEGRFGLGMYRAAATFSRLEAVQ